MPGPALPERWRKVWRRHGALTLLVVVTMSVFAVRHSLRERQATPPPVGTEINCTAHEIIDGDTVVVGCEQGNVRVRLWGIDAPESRQVPYGLEAQHLLQSLLPPGSAVRVQVLDHDRYGRTVARLHVSGKDLGLTLVQAGRAVVYKRYNKSSEYRHAEGMARQQRLGIWAVSGPQQDPAAWRKVNVRY